jgi:hypothetical protein
VSVEVFVPFALKLRDEGEKEAVTPAGKVVEKVTVLFAGLPPSETLTVYVAVDPAHTGFGA